MIDRDSRRRALEDIRSPDTASIADLSLNKFELYDLRKEIKAKRYALFAVLIDKLILMVETERFKQPDNSFAPSPYRNRSNDGYGQLRLDALMVFINAAEILESTEESRQLEELADLRSQLEIDSGYITTIGQLAAGSDTAISTMLTLLKNIPASVEYHAPGELNSSDELAEIARGSVGLPWN